MSAAFVPRLMTLVPVTKLSPQNVPYRAFFDSMDDQLDDQATYGCQKQPNKVCETLDGYAIITNASASPPTQQGSFNDTLSQRLHWQSCTVTPTNTPLSQSTAASRWASSTSSTFSRRATCSSDLPQHPPSSLQRFKQLWSQCKNKLRTLTSKQLGSSGSSSNRSSSSTGALLTVSAGASHNSGPAGMSNISTASSRSHSYSSSHSSNHSGNNTSNNSNNLFRLNYSGSHSSNYSSSHSSRHSSRHSSSHSSNYSGSHSSNLIYSCSDSGSADKGSLDDSHVHLLLGASPSCLVFTPQALAEKTRHWQHAVYAMDALENWWKL